MEMMILCATMLAVLLAVGVFIFIQVVVYEYQCFQYLSKEKVTSHKLHDVLQDKKKEKKAVADLVYDKCKEEKLRAKKSCETNTSSSNTPATDALRAQLQRIKK